MIGTKKYDYHLSTRLSWGAWICYDEEIIYINLQALEKQRQEVNKQSPKIKLSMDEFMASSLSHEEIHRCIYFLEGREVTRKIDSYVRGQLNKNNIKRLIKERMW